MQKTVTAQSTGKDYIQIALGILEKKDLPPDMQKNVGLRKWAVGLLNYYSAVTLDEDTAEKLINSETELPMVKSGFFSISPVTVRVRTHNKDGLEVSGCEVWFVPRGLLDYKDRYSRFDRVSSPTSAELPPGNYLIWTHTTAGDGRKISISVGAQGENEQDIDIPAP